MITNWNDLLQVHACWAGSPKAFLEAANALNAAMCQHDIEASLQPPAFILHRTSDPGVWQIEVNGQLMLSYTLTELQYTAVVVIVP
jgi:hypothetical protein